ncbi:hypothetical protein [Streptomyces sp. BYX5S]
MAPTASDARLATICAQGSGMIYATATATAAARSATCAERGFIG